MRFGFSVPVASGKPSSVRTIRRERLAAAARRLSAVGAGGAGRSRKRRHSFFAAGGANLFKFMMLFSAGVFATIGRRPVSDNLREAKRRRGEGCVMLAAGRAR
ncbi:MAG: hypothetical protein BroJett013_01560 [Alphaproteobacteria bacterium]|nr:MAG: hypothetical protein BroJett013_01560 [Alphaproteobacteria bacterium]